MAEDHGLALYRLALGKCYNPADAWDLVQESFVKALRHRPAIHGRRELRAWLARVVNNMFIDRCRASAQRVAVIDLDGLPAPEDEGVRSYWRIVTTDQIESLLPRLNPTLRSVFVPHLAGRSIPDIAGDLGISGQQVSARLFRARKRLRAMLLDDLSAEEPGVATRAPPSS
jgi:RNA polymerase sigma-70 factor (ECF subfamily)